MKADDIFGVVYRYRLELIHDLGCFSKLRFQYCFMADISVAVIAIEKPA